MRDKIFIVLEDPDGEVTIVTEYGSEGYPFLSLEKLQEKLAEWRRTKTEIKVTKKE